MRHSRRATAQSPQPHTFECSGCEYGEVSQQAGIPVGWSILRTRLLCPDCTTSAVQRARRSARR